MDADYIHRHLNVINARYHSAWSSLSPEERSLLIDELLKRCGIYSIGDDEVVVKVSSLESLSHSFRCGCEKDWVGGSLRICEECRKEILSGDTFHVDWLCCTVAELASPIPGMIERKYGCALRAIVQNAAARYLGLHYTHAAIRESLAYLCFCEKAYDVGLPETMSHRHISHVLDRAFERKSLAAMNEACDALNRLECAWTLIGAAHGVSFPSGGFPEFSDKWFTSRITYIKKAFDQELHACTERMQTQRRGR